MQRQFQDISRQFENHAATMNDHIIPSIESAWNIRWEQAHVLDIGCGEGGTLAPLARRGSSVCGVDIDSSCIENARLFFSREGLTGRFISSDFFELDETRHKYDLIIVRDVIEYITDKQGFMRQIKQYLAPRGIIFVEFPAWQSPFGGQQQLAHNRIVAHMPYVHLLPRFLYKYVLQLAGESNATIATLIDIKEDATTIELFRHIIAEAHYHIVRQQLYLVAPGCEARYGRRPCRLPAFIARIPWVRNFFSTSCSYLLSEKDERSQSPTP